MKLFPCGKTTISLFYEEELDVAVETGDDTMANSIESCDLDAPGASAGALAAGPAEPFCASSKLNMATDMLTITNANTRGFCAIS
jgi:hypothetical protein